MAGSGAAGSAGSSGGTGAGGSSGGAGGGSGSGGAGGSIGPSKLPIPPGGGVPKPAGAPGNLKVLDWAGFKAAASYSFDDSQPSQIEHYAELAATGVPLTFYLNSGASSQPNYDSTWMKAANAGHELGNHTVHHCHADLTGCSGTALASTGAEIDDCSKYVLDHYGQTCFTMASPFGDGGWVEPARSRFLVNRGVAGGMIAPNDSTDPFNLPTIAAAGGEAAGVFSGAIDTARTSGKWVIFLFHSILPTSQNWYAGVEIASITGSVSHGKSLGDVWIDTVLAVGAYWRAQKMLSSVVPTTSGGQTTYSWTLPAHFPPGSYLRVKVDGGTLKQAGKDLAWNDHGYYEVALDAGSLTLSP